jgi:uncharacterized membrane protein YeaQ/YmgE (transglycosylase-associated protein family)
MTVDHRARQRVMIASIIVGAIIGLVAENLFEFSISWATILCLAGSGVVQVGGGFFYVQSSQKMKRATVQIPSKRRFFEIAGAATVLSCTLLVDVPGRVALASERKLLQISNTPNSPKSTFEAKQLLSVARAAEIKKISLPLLEETGTKFIEAGLEDPAAWNTALEFLNYRSFINASSNVPRFTPPLIDDEVHTNYRFNTVNHASPKMHVSGFSPPDSEALLNAIGQNQNRELPQGRAYIFMEGETLVLDGLQLRNVVLNGVTVYYEGHSVIMTNVYFINCKFAFSANDNGQDLAKFVLISGPALSFSALG